MRFERKTWRCYAKKSHTRLAIRLTAFLNTGPEAEEGENEEARIRSRRKGVTVWGAVCVVLGTQ